MLELIRPMTNPTNWLKFSKWIMILLPLWTLGRFCKPYFLILTRFSILSYVTKHKILLDKGIFRKKKGLTQVETRDPVDTKAQKQ